MAQYHVYASYIRKHNGSRGGSQMAAYLERRDLEQPVQQTRYITRQGQEQADLVASGSANLPRWAHGSAAAMWRGADDYEREGGVIARVYVFTLPRELSAQGQRDLADDLRAVFFARYPHTWAIHTPEARDQSGANPHLHVMFSTRRDDEDRHWASPAEHWFRRAATWDKDPLSGGVPKDGSWDSKVRLQGVRYETAMLMNAALEREGVPAAVSPLRLVDQGHTRQGRHYDQFGTPAFIAETQVQQAILRQDYHPWETEMNRLAWHQQKAREHLHDLSRQAMIDRARDRFWIHDMSPLRQQERAQSVERALAREWARLDHDRDPQPTTLRAVQRERPRLQTREAGLHLSGHLEDIPHGGAHVREADREHEGGW